MAKRKAVPKKRAVSKKKSLYGKRPMWQWVLLYIIIGGVIYAGIYYFFMGGKSGYNYNSSQNSANYDNYAQ